MTRFSTLRSLAPILPLIIAVFTVALAVLQEPADVPPWAFPGSPKDSAVVDSTRLHRVPPGTSMHTVAMSATEADVVAAARYFSGLPFTPRVRVIEAARIPRMRQAAFVYARFPGAGTEPIGSRIVEGPPDFERHELRDDAMIYVAYVPPGSIKRGRSIATKGTNGLATACVTCHGTTLVGTGLIPPLAGRYPTYLVRQLLAFKTGARSTAASQPMQPVVAGMSVGDMIAVAAYAATLAPARHSR